MRCWSLIDGWDNRSLPPDEGDLLCAVAPRSSQHAQPISEAQFFDQRLAKATLTHRPDQYLQSGGIAEFRRDHCAVEVGAKSNAVLTGMFEHVLDMLDNQFHWRVLVVTAVRTQEARREIDADETAGFTDGRQLPVGQIARMRADGMRVGMRGDQRRIADFGDIPEAPFVEMR